MAEKKVPAKPAKATPAAEPAKPSHPNVYAAKLAAMRDARVVQMQKADAGHAYVPEDEVIDVAREVLLNHGLVVSPRYVRIEKHQPFTTRVGGTLNAAVVTVEYRLTHVESMTHDEGASGGEGVDVGDKAVGMAMTRALLHFLRQTLCLRTGFDSDRKDSDTLASAPKPRQESVLPGVELTEEDARPQPAAAGQNATKPEAKAATAPPPGERHNGNGKTSHRADEPGMKRPKPEQEPVDPRPPSQRPGLPREKVEATIAVLDRAETQDRLDAYRRVYTQERNFNQAQIEELDKKYRQCVDQLAKRK